MLFDSRDGEVIIYDCEPGPDGVWRPVRRRAAPCYEVAAADYESAGAVARLVREVRRERSQAAGVTVECRRRE